MSFLTCRCDLPQKLQRSCSFESVGRATPLLSLQTPIGRRYRGPHTVAPERGAGSGSGQALHDTLFFARRAGFLQSRWRGSVGVQREAVAQPEYLEQAGYRSANADHREAPAHRAEALGGLEQGVRATRVHEGDVAEGDHDLPVALVDRTVEFGDERGRRQEVDLAR